MSQKHVTKSRHGIYYFQYWLPKRLKNTTYNMKVFRLSLNTSNRREAVKESHRLIVLMYDLEDKYNNKPKSFGDALLKLQQRYKNMSGVDELTKSIDEYQINYTHGLTISNKLEGVDTSSEDIGTQEYMSQFNQYDMDCYELVLDKNTASVTNEIIEQSSSKNPKAEGRLISQYLESFIAHKEWAESTEIEYRDKINLFIQIVTDKPISELSKDDVNDYSDKIIQLPSNAHKKPKYKNKSIDELLEMDVPKSELIRGSTIGNHFSKVSEFLGRMVKNGVIVDRYINEPLQGKVKKGKGKDRVPFDKNELNILFESEAYISGRYGYKRITASNYWIPLISLLSGMRLNEICQLWKSDIKKKGDVWYFDINDKGDNSNKKHLKTENSERLVPIHKELIRLGFINYIEGCNTVRIFPTLTYLVKGHYGGSTSKWYTRYLQKYGVWIKTIKVFHSLRYNFVTIARKGSKIDVLTVKQLIGHATKEDITDGYTGLDALPELNKAVQKIKYDIDFSKIKKWYTPR